MSRSECLLHPFCFPEMEDVLQRAGTKEIAPDVWLITGNLGLSFFLAPPSSNVYILRDEKMVFLLDSGLHPFYRRHILDLLEKFKKDGAKTLVLMVSQGHWDHALNNDVILEAGYDEVRFLLPEPEIDVIESVHHWLGDFRRQQKYFEPDWSIWVGLLVQFEEYARGCEAYRDERFRLVWEAVGEAKANPDGPRMTAALKLLADRVLLCNYRSLAERAEVLSLAGRETRSYGDVEVEGWQVGRFFVIHDGSHSPGHISLYDPKYKLLISGDVTIEINPAFTDTSMKRLIQAARNFRIMAEQGFVELAADAHRNEDGFKLITDFLGMVPLHPVQLKDMARGREECTAFFRMFEDYYRETIQETLAAHARLGEAAVWDIVRELRKSENRHAKFKMALPFPSRPELTVYCALTEYGYAQQRRDGGRILFTPPEKWTF